MTEGNMPRDISGERDRLMTGDPARIEQQHAQGKHTARERMARLFDAGSFIETDALIEGGNIVTGYGTVQGRAAYALAQDYTSCGGALGQKQADKAAKILDMARVTGAPVVLMLDGAGLKVTEGAQSMTAAASMLSRVARLSGVCPIIAMAMGPCYGVETLFVKLADFSIAVKKTGFACLQPGSVMPPVNGKQLSSEELGGADALAEMGAVTLTAEGEDAAIALCASLLDLLPSCNAEDAPFVESDDLNRLLTACDEKDGLLLAEQIADNHQLIECSPAFGKSIRTLLARVGGYSVGIVASDYAADNGRLSNDGMRKAARFVRLCDCYQIPIISLINSDGFAVAGKDESGDAMSAAAQLLYAYAEATAPKAAVVTGHAIGGACVAMGGKAVADVAYAWPNAVIAPLTPEAGAATFFCDQLKAGESREEAEKRFIETSGALCAARSGIVDDVIEPSQTRKHLIAALEMLSSKRDVNLPRKHGNLPL